MLLLLERLIPYGFSVLLALALLFWGDDIKSWPSRVWTESKNKKTARLKSECKLLTLLSGSPGYALLVLLSKILSGILTAIQAAGGAFIVVTIIDISIGMYKHSYQLFVDTLSTNLKFLAFNFALVIYFEIASVEKFSLNLLNPQSAVDRLEQQIRKLDA